jgi:hypothetical protein
MTPLDPFAWQRRFGDGENARVAIGNITTAWVITVTRNRMDYFAVESSILPLYTGFKSKRYCPVIESCGLENFCIKYFI